MRIGLDLDGTLISCKEKHIHLMTTLAKAYNVKFDSEQYWNSKRNGCNNYSALMALGVEEKEAVCLNEQWFANVENLEWSCFDKILPDVDFCLNRLRSFGYSLHLISARRNKEYAWQQLRNLNLIHYFNSIDFVNHNKGEEKTTFFKKRKIMFYIGDTEYDKISADSVNVTCFLVTTGMRSDILLKRYSSKLYYNLKSILMELVDE